MAQTTPTITNGVSVVNTTGFPYRAFYYERIASGMSKNILVGEPFYNNALTSTNWTLLAFDTYANLLAELTSLDINTSKLKDPTPV